VKAAQNERAIAREGTNPGRTANKAREHLRAVLSWAWEQEWIDTGRDSQCQGSNAMWQGGTI